MENVVTRNSRAVTHRAGAPPGVRPHLIVQSNKVESTLLISVSNGKQEVQTAIRDAPREAWSASPTSSFDVSTYRHDKENFLNIYAHPRFNSENRDKATRWIFYRIN